MSGLEYQPGRLVRLNKRCSVHVLLMKLMKLDKFRLLALICDRDKFGSIWVRFLDFRIHEKLMTNNAMSYSRKLESLRVSERVTNFGCKCPFLIPQYHNALMRLRKSDIELI